MDPKLQTSFIPKKDSGVRRNVPIGFFNIVGYTVFALSLILALGLYAGNHSLKNTIESKKDELNDKVKNFNVGGLEELIRFDARLNTVATLLDNHISVSKLFELLADSTAQSIQFTSFDYSRDGEQLSVTLDGKAPDFASLAFQSDTFSSRRFLKDQVFSDVTLLPEGGVSFVFTANVDPLLVKYIVEPKKTEQTGSTPSATTTSTTATSSLINN